MDGQKESFVYIFNKGFVHFFKKQISIFNSVKNVYKKNEVFFFKL